MKKIFQICAIVALLITAGFAQNAISLAQDKPAKSKPAAKKIKLEQGLHARYKHAKFKDVPNFKSFIPDKVFKLPNIGLGFREHFDHYAVWFTGYIKIPESGKYTFTIASDSAAKLFIANQAVMFKKPPADQKKSYSYKAVKNDVKLPAGVYKFRLGYFEQEGPEGIQLLVSSAKLKKQIVPSSWFYRNPNPKLPGKLKPVNPIDPRKNVRVTYDISAAPEKKEMAESIVKMIKKTYPKVIDVLIKDDFQAPSRVHVIFKKNQKYPAAALGNILFINLTWLDKHPGDIGMVAHELTHVVQGYPLNVFWIGEGIADYTRYKLGYQTWWSYPRCIPGKNHYKQGYGTAAAFLMWIEKKYDKDLIPVLNKTVRDLQYTKAFFKERTSKELDELWDEFIEDIKKNPLPVPPRPKKKAAAKANAKNNSHSNQLTQSADFFISIANISKRCD